MTKIRDWAVKRDLRALSVMKRTCVIDFLQWTDDSASRAYVHPRIVRQGNQVTMQHLRAIDFLGLPSAVSSRPLAALEVSVDFYPGRSTLRSEIPSLLADCFEALFRRLAPWQQGVVRNRIYVGGAAGTGSTAYSERRTKVAPSGQLWMHAESLEDRLNIPARRPGLMAGRWSSETVWYGDRVFPSWDHLPFQPMPRAQVKLYCKTTDSGLALPLSEWRVRVEVMVNGAQLAQLGVISVGQIDQSTLSALISNFVLLGQVTGRELPTVSRRGGLMSDWIVRERRRRERMDQVRALQRAPLDGMLSTLPHDHLLKFKAVPELMKMVRVPVADFFKQQRRARALLISKSAGQMSSAGTGST